MTNPFKSRLSNKSTSDLLYYVENSSLYEVKAVEAAIEILEERNVEIDNPVEFKNQRENQIEEKEIDYLKVVGIPVPISSHVHRFIHLFVDNFIIQLLIAVVNLIPYVSLNNFFGLIIYPVYHFFFEYHYQWTPAKLLTNTIVIDKIGDRPTMRNVLLRSLIRIIPFEPLSFLGSLAYGWHDKWSETYVIKERDLVHLRDELGLPKVELKPAEYTIASYIILVSMMLLIATAALFL